MNRTTGAELTALSIAALTSVDKNREAIGENLGCVNLEANVDGRAAVCRNADDKGLVNILVAIVYRLVKFV